MALNAGEFSFLLGLFFMAVYFVIIGVSLAAQRAIITPSQEPEL